MPYKDLTIESVTIDTQDVFIYFVDTNSYLEIGCYGDCCSSAFIIFPKDFNVENLIGKKIIEITTLCQGYQSEDSDEDLEYYDRVYETSDYYDEQCEKHTEYYFIFDDGTSQNFLLYGLSNGYYGAYLSVNFIEDEEKENEEIITNNVTFIIGLPGSGKTSLIKDKFSSLKVYDDFLSTISNSSIINWMQLHPSEDVVFSDPRFTNAIVFKTFIESCSSVLSKSKINLIIFDNNAEKCKENIKKRQEDYKLHLISLNTLKYKYNPNSKIYSEYSITRMEVFES